MKAVRPLRPADLRLRLNMVGPRRGSPPAYRCVLTARAPFELSCETSVGCGLLWFRPSIAVSSGALSRPCPGRLPPPWPGLGYFSIERDGKGVRRSRRRRVTGGCSTRCRKVSTADFPAIENVRYVRAFRSFLDTPTRSEVSFVNTHIRHGRLLPDQAASALR